MPNQSVFSTLAKYSSSQSENYLTESFVYLINSLLEWEHSAALEFLNQLCAVNGDFSFDADEVPFVSTQDVTGDGTPDIKIETPNKLIYIEVKDESPLGDRQLEKYRKVLESSNKPKKRLILLTRYATSDNEAEIAKFSDKHICWAEVDQILDNVIFMDTVARYLLEQFKTFLEDKHMSIQKISPEYINGMSALSYLLNMIELAVKNTGIRFYSSYPRAVGWNFKGFWLEEKQFWCGIHFNSPSILTFELTHKDKYDKTLLETYSDLEKNGKVNSGKKRIWFRFPLDDSNFFSLDKDKQLKAITNFITEAYADAQKMRIK